MNIIRRAFATTLATGILLAGLTTMAQQRTYRGSYQSTRALLARIENRTNIFRNSLDAALDNSSLDGTNAEDNINMFVQDFDSSVSRLRQQVESRQATASDAQDVLDRAALIDRFVTRRRLASNVQRDWTNVRLQLNQLAQMYNVTWRPAQGRITRPPLPSTVTNALTGTYRLDPSRSDDPARRPIERREVCPTVIVKESATK